jgi:uroporphyrin-III C-methyltransferase/precorrin-2 dehydrogenase/sirohydrochlorin ferrochelatase
MRQISEKPSDPARIAPLAKLPVFYDLQGKRCLVAGGSEAAAWKAELLAAAGGQVSVVSDSFCIELGRLAKMALSAGSIDLVRRPWRREDFEGTAIAIADFPDAKDIERFAAAARQAGVPMNAIDRPDHCDFQFGSIVNRSPVIVGISTDGAAPILGQEIRRKIELLLPASLSDWARAAKRVRRRVAGWFPDLQRRRVYWERFSTRALSGELFSTDSIVSTDARGAPQGKGGHVTLVGAGPGDPEFLTVKAIQALQAADVILFDALVSDAVLEFARREAKRMLVGKRGYRKSCRQDDINEMMVTLARSGKHVVRLKGGDPSVFGRSGEEIKSLETHGIPFEIVPGITAASAAVARLGVSLTHRDCAQSVRFTTGHGRAGGLTEDLDWAGIADPKTTNIFYMARSTGKALAGRLMQHGLPADTPVALVSGVSRSDEEILHLNLARLLKENPPAMSGPVLMCVGTVFGPALQKPLELGASNAIAVAKAWG